MQKIQLLLGEADKALEKECLSLSAPIVANAGVLYQVSHNSLRVPLTYGKMKQLPNDYEKDIGAGRHLPQSALLQGILVDTRKAAEDIIRIAQKHDRSMAAMENMCHKYLTRIPPQGNIIHRGGLFRIEITAKTAVFQILFMIGSNQYAVVYEAPLENLTNAGAHRGEIFDDIPPQLEVPAYYGSPAYVPADFDSISSLLEELPRNIKETPCRSRKIEVFKDIGALAEDLLSAIK